MSNFFEQLEGQLLAAAGAQVQGAGHRRWNRLRHSAGFLPILASVAVVVAVLVVALTTLVHGPTAPHQSAAHAPPAGSPPPLTRPERRYLREATTAAHRTPACGHLQARRPAISNGSPNPALLSTLGVLRRPETRQDSLPRGLAGQIETSQGPIDRSVYIHHVRLARVAHGISYYLVPVVALSGRRAALENCYHAIRMAVQAELPRIPARLRAPILAYEAWGQTVVRRIGQEEDTDGVCLVFSAAGGRGGLCAASASDIKRWGMIAPFGLLSGVVPDGVATVTVDYSAMTGKPAQTASSRVVGNIFVTTLRQSGGRQWRLSMTWRSSDGRIVKHVAASSYDYRYGGGGFCEAQSRRGRESSVC